MMLQLNVYLSMIYPVPMFRVLHEIRQFRYTLSLRENHGFAL